MRNSRILIAASAAILGFATAAHAQAWGAVGVGPGGAWGWSVGHWSGDEAVNSMQGYCEWDCDNVHTFVNSCGAIAISSSGAWGFAARDNEEWAREVSVFLCEDHGRDCWVEVSACAF